MSLFEQISREKEIQAARRHTRVVKVLRVILPSVCVFVIAGVFLVNWIAQATDFDVSVESVYVEDGSLTMEDARMAGFNSKSEAYEIIADKAIQQLTDPNSVELNGIQGVLDTTENEQSTITANQGFYNTATEQLRLEDDIVVRSTEGYEIFLDTADMDLKSGRVTSDTPVEIQMIGGTIEAQGLEIENRGEKITFKRGVSMTIIPNQHKQAEE